MMTKKNLSIKWRASFFAYGRVKVTINGVEKNLDITLVLPYDQRKLYAFGTWKLGKQKVIEAVINYKNKNNSQPAGTRRIQIAGKDNY